MPVHLRCLILAAITFLTGVSPSSAGDIRAVIELFTSQACSSCPPADRLLGELAADERLVALSLPVDYWDYLGWRDTLALHAHSVRQKAYAESRGDRQVYTPQALINGVSQIVGSDRGAIERMVAAAGDRRTLMIPVSLQLKGNTIEIEIGPGTAAAPASVWMLGVTRFAPVEIMRGENRGKTITYHNVVKGWTRLGEWAGSPVRISVPLTDIAGMNVDMAVVLIQAGTAEEPGPIRGAAKLSLR